MDDHWKISRKITGKMFSLSYADYIEYTVTFMLHGDANTWILLWSGKNDILQVSADYCF